MKEDSLKIKKHFEVLEILFNTMPFVFWKDVEGRYQGANLNQARNLGFNSPTEFIGKTIFEILEDQASAKLIDDIDRKVMEENTTLITEEKLCIHDEVKNYLTQKSPIHDENGKVIGMIGFAMDITRLTLKKEAVEKQRDLMVSIANQAVHDIRSPSASLLMIVKSCQSIPEPQRIALRDAANSINDIANNLLQQYKTQEQLEVSSDEKEKKSLLVSVTLLEVLTDKKYQYQSLPVDFKYAFDQSGYFAFVDINGSDFKRMISNLINNSVDAFSSKEGRVTLKLEAAEPDKVKIILQDNGKGMPAHIIQKIMANVSVTEGKQGGHGIGMQQVKAALETANGKMEIQSVVGQGTVITLHFPRAPASHWIAEEIVLNADDVVVILDDDTSIHGAWDAHLGAVLKNQKNIQIKHFAIGRDAIDFMNGLDSETKQKVFLLTDYELLKQGLNGLDVISKSGVSRAVLVTSHYANANVREMATKLGIKILPKQMASEVPIKISGEHPDIANKSSQSVDLVLVEDNSSFAESMIAYLKVTKSTEGHEYQVDHYTDPRIFLENLNRYSKGTIISLDSDLGVSGLDGLELARRLHERGYKHLYLLSGKDFPPEKIPSYLTFILKTDMDLIAKI